MRWVLVLFFVGTAFWFAIFSNGIKSAEPGSELSWLVPNNRAQIEETPVPAQRTVKDNVYGAMNGDGRVVLRIRGDAHLVVRNANGQILLNRDLKAGDSYQVPNTQGVTMATDNAGAIEVNLDGKAVSMAGELGEGLPGRLLDPAAILQWSASGQTLHVPGITAEKTARASRPIIATEPPNPVPGLRNSNITEWNRLLPSLRLTATQEMIVIVKRPSISAADLMACIDTTAESTSAADMKVAEVASLCLAMLQ